MLELDFLSTPNFVVPASKLWGVIVTTSHTHNKIHWFRRNFHDNPKDRFPKGPNSELHLKMWFMKQLVFIRPQKKIARIRCRAWCPWSEGWLAGGFMRRWLWTSKRCCGMKYGIRMFRCSGRKTPSLYDHSRVTSCSVMHLFAAQLHQGMPNGGSCHCIVSDSLKNDVTNKVAWT